MPLLSVPETTGTVLLSWSYSDWPTGIRHHRAQLERLSREGRYAWIRLTSAFAETRFQLTPVEHTFPESGSNEAIQRQLRQWQSPHHIKFHRTYLVAQEHVREPCYDITDYVQRCLSGDLAIANRLRGRTIFRLQQVETGAYDLLSRSGTYGLAERVLKTYTHAFSDFLGNVVVGFCCELPSFLSPLKVPALKIPWSPELGQYFQSIWEEQLTDYLPLVFYGAYDAAAVRSAFWSGLTQQFSEVCIGGFRRFCHHLGLQLAIEIPASAKALGFDLGTILKRVDGSILVGASNDGTAHSDSEATEQANTTGNETAQAPIPSADPIDTPKRFLIAKWVTSRLANGDSQAVAIWRANPPSLDQRAYDSVLGFNSWLSSGPEKVSTENRNLEEEHTAKSFDSRRVHLEKSKSYATETVWSIGVPQRPVLMISPVHSLWSKADERTWNEITQSWGWLCQTVWDLGYDFDIVTETDFASSEFDKKRRSLCVNEKFYRIILLPSCASLQEATVSRLTEVLKGRGKLITVDSVPYLLNGKLGLDTHPLELLLYHRRSSILRGTVDEKADTLKRLLEKWVKPVLRIYLKPDNTPTGVIRLHHRQAEELDLYYLFNASEHFMETLIEIRGEVLRVEEWGPTSGEQVILDHWHANGNTYLTQSFDRWQGKLIVAQTKVKKPLLA